MSFKFSLSSGWQDHLEAAYGPDLDSELFSDTPAIAWQFTGDWLKETALPDISPTEPAMLDPGDLTAA